MRDVIYQFRQAGVSITSRIDSITLECNSVRHDYDDLMDGRLSAELLRQCQSGFLPGYAPEHSEAFSEWLAAYRARTTLRLCRTLSKEIDRAKSVGDWLATEHAARACLALEPAHEEATLALAETLAASGSKAQAVNLLDQYVRDLGPSRAQLQVSATVLRRRISERVPDLYRSGLTLPFLGRDAEMAILFEHFELARSGESHCVAIVGDAGVGKTRLAEEFCIQAAMKGARVERVVTQPHDAHRPMATFADLVPRLLKLPGALGCAPESIAALKRLTTHDSDNPSTADVPSEAVAWGISRAIADLVDAIATEATVILVVDDIQWADDLSRHAIATLVSAKQSRRLLMLLTSRDRGIVQYFAKRAERLRPISLRPLATSSVAGIVNRLLTANELVADEELCGWLAQSSGGNPFFLRCLVSHLQSTGERFVVPSTISSLLDQQLATLGPEAFSVLSICVTLGRHSSIDHIVDALGISHLQLQTALRELEASHLISLAGRRVEPTHWLVAESVNRSTPPIAQSMLHRQAALLLERKSETNEVASRLWDCAEHWILADEHGHATRAINSCADYSMEIGRPREAAEALLRAAAIMPRGNAISLATRAVQLADTAGEMDLVCRGADFVRSRDGTINYHGFELAEIFARTANQTDMAMGFEALRPWLSENKPLDLRVRAAIAAVVLADSDSNAKNAHETFSAISKELELVRVGDDIPRLTFLLIYHSRFGTIDISLLVAEHLLQLAQNLDDAQAAVIQRRCAAAFFRAGLFERGAAVLTTAFENARSHGLLRLQCVAASMLAGIHYDLRNDEVGKLWYSRAEAIADQVEGFRGSLADFITDAEIACTRGDSAKAKQALERGRAHLAKNPPVNVKRWIRVLEAWIAELEGETIADPQLLAAELVAHHVPNGEPGDLSDAEIAVAISALHRGGFGNEGRELVTRYVEVYRRRRGPVGRSLQDALKRVGW
ncbi:MAG TPA: AAA family ATPase [Gemmatimonadaceae bacterium]